MNRIINNQGIGTSSFTLVELPTVFTIIAGLALGAFENGVLIYHPSR